MTPACLAALRAMVVASCWLATAGAQPAAAPAPFIVGLGQSIHDPDGAAAAMSGLGVQSMRVDAPWSAIEIAPGRYAIPAWLDKAVDSAKARGIEPLLILAYGHPLYGTDKPRTASAIAAFARYATFVTQHFAGRVRLFDLWNEWDAHTGRTTPGTAEDYAAFVKRVYPAIKAANPDAVVLSGGVSSLGLNQSWVERFIAAGGLEFVDGLSLHPYNFLQRGADTPESAIATVDRVHALLRAAGRPLPIYVTEMGYPAFDGKGGVTRDVAAAYLARFMLLASTRDYVAGVWWYCLRDQGADADNKEHNFGVLDASLHAKPAADALRGVAALLRDGKRFHDDGAGPQHRLSATRADGTAIALAWDGTEPASRLLAAIEAAAKPATTPSARAR